MTDSQFGTAVRNINSPPEALPLSNQLQQLLDSWPIAEAGPIDASGRVWWLHGPSPTDDLIRREKKAVALATFLQELGKSRYLHGKGREDGAQRVLVSPPPATSHALPTLFGGDPAVILAWMELAVVRTIIASFRGDEAYLIATSDPVRPAWLREALPVLSMRS